MFRMARSRALVGTYGFQEELGWQHSNEGHSILADKEVLVNEWERPQVGG